MVRGVILVRAPKTLLSPKIKGIEGVKYVFDVWGRFDAIALLDVEDLSTLKETVLKIQAIDGVRRTETLIGV